MTKVSDRLRGLLALLLRQQIESDLAIAPDSAPKWAPVLKRIDAAVDEDVSSALEPEEQALLSAPWGAFAESDLTFAAWRIEHVAVLLRSLGSIEALLLDGPTQHETLAAALPLFPSATQIEASSNAVAADTLAAEARQHGLWKWRLDVEWKHRHGGTTPNGLTYEAFIGSRVEQMEGVAKAPLGGAVDLAVGGQPLSAIPMEAVRELRCVHGERALAFAWLKTNT